MTGDQPAAGAGYREPLWDATVDGETEDQQAARHARAIAICRTCPAIDPCAATVNPRTDDGVRGGRLLPTIHDSDRRSPYPAGFPPQREGVGYSVRRHKSTPGVTGSGQLPIRGPRRPLGDRLMETIAPRPRLGDEGARA